MGAWSHEPFGNDTACDWAYDLEATSDLSAIESAIDTAIQNAEDYLEAPEGEEAIAAIEVLAKLKGKGTQTDAYTEAVDQWVSKINIQPSAELIQKALKVLSLVLAENSELVELWEGQDEWESSVSALKAVLAELSSSMAGSV